MKILLLNAGSSSLKATLVESDSSQTVASGHADWAGTDCRYRYVGPDGTERREDVTWRSHADAVRHVIEDLRTREPVALATLDQLQAVGHRVVHGGEFRSAERITSDIQSRLRELAELAPLHNIPSLNTMAAAQELLPEVPQIAAFDTMFHSTMPPEAYVYPVPGKWTREWGVRRFGFHGLSHAYCSRQAAQLLNRPLKDLKLVNCHLGHGCSAAAIAEGRCIDTTMGFTPLEGLMMGTRSGSIDPAIVTFVQQRHGLTADQVDAALNRQSGLLGVSGVTADLREILAQIKEGHQPSQLAFDIYTRRIRQAIGALAVTLGGIDVLVFTAGVGENSPEVRAAVCHGLECLNLNLDYAANRDAQPDADIAANNSAGRILVIRAREDVEMLKQVKEVLSDR